MDFLQSGPEQGRQVVLNVVMGALKEKFADDELATHGVIERAEPVLRRVLG